MNTRDALSGMDPRYAGAMVNLFPSTSGVQLRKGFAIARDVKAAAAGVVQQYFSGFVKYGDANLFVRADASFGGTGNLVDVGAGTLTTSWDSGKGYAQFSNAAGAYTVCAGDEYWTYDGTTWTDNSAALTVSSGVNTTTHVATHRNRLWFVRNVLGVKAHYLPTNAITGLLIEFPLGGIASKGGTLKYIASWTLDGGTGGSDDMIVFITTNGQIIVYQGTDPATQSTWRLVGVFDVCKAIAPPIKYGADLLLPLEDGLYSMTQILRGNTGQEFAISDSVRADWQALALISGPNIVSGPRITSCYSSKLNMIVVSFPTNFRTLGKLTSDWLVMNTITKAWTRFTGLDAYAVAEFAGDIYFCNATSDSGGAGNSYVYKFGTAGDDNGSAITGYARQAYTNLGAPGNEKLISGLRPTFTVTGSHTVGFGVEREYRNELTGSSSIGNAAAYATGSYKPFLSYSVMGDAIAVFAQMSSSASAGEWFDTTVLFQTGNNL